jgi:predicted PurR-regulated permease PerM
LNSSEPAIVRLRDRPLFWASWIVILWGLEAGRAFLVPILLASLLAFLVAPIVRFLRSKNFPEVVALAVVGVLLFLPFLVISILALSEGSSLVRDYPHLIERFREEWARFLASPTAVGWNLSGMISDEDIGSKIGEWAGHGIGFAVEGLKAIAEAGTRMILVLFFALLMVAARTELGRGLTKLSSQPETLQSVIRLVEKFLVTRLGIAAIVAVVDIAILFGFGIRYCVLMGCFLGVSTLIPLVGFVAGIIPPLIVAFSLGHHSGGAILAMVLLLYAISSFEAHILTPKLLGRQLNLNLFATFLGIFSGELLWGVWGMVLAVPLLGVLRILLAASPRFKGWADLLSDHDVEVEVQKPKTKRVLR